MKPLANPRRVCVANDVWSAALIQGGLAEELVRLGMTGRVTLLTSESLLLDLSRELDETLAFYGPARSMLLDLLREACEVRPSRAPAAGVLDARAEIVDLAFRESADAIVTSSEGSLRLMSPGASKIPVLQLSSL